MRPLFPLAAALSLAVSAVFAQGSSTYPPTTSPWAAAWVAAAGA
jgi:hypothetical protein